MVGVSKAGVTEVDRGWNDIKRRLLDAEGYSLEIGVFDTSPRIDTKLTNVEVAGAMEFGTDRIPARPFLSTGLDEHADDLFQLALSLQWDVATGVMSLDVALNNLGHAAVQAIRDTIDRGHPSWPPLSAVTIARKGSSRPLVDTKSMYNAIEYRVVANA